MKKILSAIIALSMLTVFGIANAEVTDLITS